MVPLDAKKARGIVRGLGNDLLQRELASQMLLCEHLQ